MLLEACLNGARLPQEHPALPVTPEQLARDAAAVRRAGADAVHLHVKDEQGHDTFDGAALDAAMHAVRRAAVGLPVGVTTGAWALPDVDDRVAAVGDWPELPDFASVNWHEEGADDMARALLGRGVQVEAGLWHADAVAAWARSPLAESCLRVLVELQPDDPAHLADRLVAAVLERRAVPVVVHGEGPSAWPVLRHAVARGWGVRIGLEDTLVLEDGALATGNPQLVREARDHLARRGGYGELRRRRGAGWATGRRRGS